MRMLPPREQGSREMILDPACGSKMFWFDKDNANVVFGDIRKENHILCDGRKLVIRPDVQMDFTALPFGHGVFEMVVLDPPHLKNAGKNGWQAKKYGVLPKDWPIVLELAFSECFRVLRDGGQLIFKWNEEQVRVSEVLALTSHKPLFGHKRSGVSKTHWLCFVKGLS